MTTSPTNFIAFLQDESGVRDLGEVEAPDILQAFTIARQRYGQVDGMRRADVSARDWKNARTLALKTHTEKVKEAKRKKKEEMLDESEIGGDAEEAYLRAGGDGGNE
jgi:hypothetical protein